MAAWNVDGLAQDAKTKLWYGWISADGVQVEIKGEIPEWVADAANRIEAALKDEQGGTR